ncbi:lysozyme-like [Cydia splendana]|uniref:lysozyme-like n=1 Tax=Cydia splendana TaxID=1100963 RepID=UPI00300C1E97
MSVGRQPSKMAARCVLALCFVLLVVDAKVFTRCQLTRELLKINFQRTFLSNWVCLIEQESDRNTAALVTKSARRKYYGLFQIGSEWCKEGKKGGKCDITCEALLDDDIKDDSACALKVFELEGFKYWSKWEARCKGHVLPDIEKCPDWKYPPSRSSVSPGRDKRRVRRSKRSKNGLRRLLRVPNNNANNL